MARGASGRGSARGWEIARYGKTLGLDDASRAARLEELTHGLNWLGTSLGRRGPDSVESADVDAHAAHLAARGYSALTVRRRTAALRAYLRWDGAPIAADGGAATPRPGPELPAWSVGEFVSSLVSASDNTRGAYGRDVELFAE